MSKCCGQQRTAECPGQRFGNTVQDQRRVRIIPCEYRTIKIQRPRRALPQKVRSPQSDSAEVSREQPNPGPLPPAGNSTTLAPVASDFPCQRGRAQFNGITPNCKDCQRREPQPEPEWERSRGNLTGEQGIQARGPTKAVVAVVRAGRHVTAGYLHHGCSAACSGAALARKRWLEMRRRAAIPSQPRPVRHILFAMLTSNATSLFRRLEATVIVRAFSRK